MSKPIAIALGLNFDNNAINLQHDVIQNAVTWMFDTVPNEHSVSRVE